MHVISQVTIRPHVLQLPPLSLAASIRPFAAKILAAAGVSATAPSGERARAVVGWFAANAVHPQTFLHPDGSVLNSSVLPAGETWTSFNTLFNAGGTIERDQAFWFGLFPNGLAMLAKLIGTIAVDGSVADDGMLTEYAPGKWRIRSFAAFRAPQCTLQCKMAQVVLAAIGIQSLDISTVGHDPMAYYDIEAARWLYIDPTFGEMQMMVGHTMSPLDLLQTSVTGGSAAVVGAKLPGADYLVIGYFTSPSKPADGMSWMTVHTAPQWNGGMSARAPYRFGSLPSQSDVFDRPAGADEILPQLGVGITGLRRIAQAVEVRMRSNWPGHVRFQRSTDAGITWADCYALDYCKPASGGVRYRSVDADGFAGTHAIVTI
jgi:hypothetical protein